MCADDCVADGLFRGAVSAIRLWRKHIDRGRIAELRVATPPAESEEKLRAVVDNVGCARASFGASM
jgi:hypothetical protein